MFELSLWSVSEAVSCSSPERTYIKKKVALQKVYVMLQKEKLTFFKKNVRPILHPAISKWLHAQLKRN